MNGLQDRRLVVQALELGSKAMLFSTPRLPLAGKASSCVLQLVLLALGLTHDFMRHERCHPDQIERDGRVVFSVKCLSPMKLSHCRDNSLLKYA